MSDLELQARAAGYNWGEIDDYLQGVTEDATAAGYGQDDIDRHMGFDPTNVAARAGSLIAETPAAPSDPDTGALDLSSFDWRGGYANALRDGDTRGSYDWADSVAAAALDRMDIADPTTKDKALGWASRAGDQIAAQLPGRREFADAALDVSGTTPDDPNFDTVRRNLIDHWQETGEGPIDAANRSRVNTDLNDKLTGEPPQRGALGEIGAAVNRWRGDLIFGLEHIGQEAWSGIANLTGSDDLKSLVNERAQVWAKREADWHAANQRGEGITAFVAGAVGEGVPTLAEYLAVGVPAMLTYGALHGASLAWERTGSATAAATGALIGGAEAGAPVPFLKGAAGQGLVSAAVKTALGMAATGGISSIADAIPDWVGGKGLKLPSIEEIGEAAAGGAITGALFGPVVSLASRPRIRALDLTPGAPDKVVPLDDPSLQPTPELHDRAAKLARDADRMEQLRLEREGLVPGNATEGGDFFSRKVAEPGGTDPYELAEGYRAAFGLGSIMDSLFGPIWRDQSGSMKLGSRVSMSDADRAAMRERADIVDQTVRRDEAFRDAYDWSVKKTLDPIFKAIEPHMGEWTTTLDEAIKTRDTTRLKQTKVGQLLAHMQGTNGYSLPGNHEARPWADTLRTMTDISKAYLMKYGFDMNWEKQFWPHQWKDPQNAENIFGSFWRSKSVPDFFDGIEKGLVPLYSHPIEHIFHDLTRKSAAWTREAALDHLAGEFGRDADGNILLDETGAPKGRDPNAPVLFTAKQPSGNMVPITGLTRKGIYTDRIYPRPLTPAEEAAQGEATGAVLGGSRPADIGRMSGEDIPRAVDLKAYASPEIAKMVQAWTDRYAPMSGGEKVFEMVNRASNMALAMKLLGPFYHLASTMNEMLAGSIGTAGKLLSGDLTTTDVAEAVAKATRITKELHTKGLGLATTMPEHLKLDPLMEAAINGGFRHGKRQGVYMPGRGVSIVEGLMRGSLGREIKEAYDRDGLAPVSWDVAQQVLTSASAPAFDHIIPVAKSVTTLSQLELAMRQNPTMDPAARFKAARQIIDNTDHRLGELNLNNVFWPRWVRRMLAAAMISPSWTYGTVAYTLAGLGYRIGPKGLRGAEWNPTATANLVGLAIATAGTNALVQWLWSGKLPGEASKIQSFPEAVALDLVSPRAGGVTKGWAPSRMWTPTQVKEYLDWAKIVEETYAGYKIGGAQYGIGKLITSTAKYGEAKVRPLWNSVFALIAEQDAIGHDPYLQQGGLAKFLEDQFMPIGVSQWENYRHKSNIGRVGAAMGLREAPDWIEDPRRYWGIQRWLYLKKTRDQLRQYRREQSYLR